MMASRSTLSKLSVLTILILGAAVAPPVVGQRSTRGHDLSEPADVGRLFLAPAPPDSLITSALLPDPESPARFPAFEMDTLEGGRRLLRGVSISQDGEIEELVFFEVNPVTASYTAYSYADVANGEDTGHTKSRMRKVLARELSRLREIAERNRRSVECTCPDEPCEGSWSATVTTYDPILVPLTRTSGHADWHYIDTPGICKLSASGSETCWAANPSALGTHWYNSYCSGQNFGFFGTVDYRAEGDYYNWDFALDSLSTEVSQSVRIQLLHSTGVVTSWTHSDSGEGAFLIFGSFFQAGSNNCFF